MAPATPVQPDTLITVKITFDDEAKGPKKLKVPYGVLTEGLHAFEKKLSEFLTTSEDSTPYRYERFSDSAGKNIPISYDNPAAYRQLLRAAKAKQKLKLRARLVVEQSDASSSATSTGPRPVTMEEVPEGAAASASATASRSASTPAAPTPAPAPTPAETSAAPTASSSSSKNTLKSAFAALAEFQDRPHDLTPEAVQRCIDAYPEIPGHFPQSQNETEYEKEQSKRLEEAIAKLNINEAPKAPVQPYSWCKVSPMGSVGAPKPNPVTPTQAPFGGFPQTWTDSYLNGAFNQNATASTSSNPAPLADSPAIVAVPPPRMPAFTVCCNSCERKIPDAHYHCSTCEGGDFDLCEYCIDLGITCYNPEHWMIRRYIQNGLIVNSTTEKVKPKAKPAASNTVSEKAAGKAPAKPAETPVEKPVEKPVVKPVEKPVEKPAETFKYVDDSTRIQAFRKYQIRTCNNCIRELPEYEFLHCAECYDFDLCKACFVKNDHGHHPKHAFQPCVKGIEFGWNVTRRLSAGRGYHHNAVCDGCEKFITGVRHKCSDCPDWDYCSDCVLNASFIHPDHRFIPIYEPLSESLMAKSGEEQVIHTGIYCDGPHCSANGLSHQPIRGNRYKCAVCNNKDFCATCEASPSNAHNKTHPLIKFRTPVRHVSVTTTGEHDGGRRMPVMGDRRPRMFPSGEPASSPLQETSKLVADRVRTVLDIKPTAPPVATPAKEEVKKTEVKKQEAVVDAEPSAKLLGAMFKSETVLDGTSFAPTQTFEQTWILRNTGSVAWPAGCCVRFVGGDYMGHVDPNNPAGIQELVSASESTICYKALAPGEEAPFTILLRAPSRLGKIISYWRLTTKGGIKFGDRLWCDINVRPKEEVESAKAVTAEVKATEEKPVAEKVVEEKADEKSETSTTDSQMIFPKLETESPVASVHDVATEETAAVVDEETDDFDFDDEEGWAVENSTSDDGFLTDEEYDILDASDEESIVGEARK